MPDNIYFTFSYMGEPIVARYPSSGFEGTAYTVAGMELEERTYDESLALGYLNGVPVTATQQIDRFKELARARLQYVKDIPYMGAMTLVRTQIRSTSALQANQCCRDSTQMATQ